MDEQDWLHSPEVTQLLDEADAEIAAGKLTYNPAFLTEIRSMRAKGNRSAQQPGYHEKAGQKNEPLC